MFDCGLRLYEVVTLTVEHVRVSDGYLIADGKGNKERIVFIGYQIRRLLLCYLSRRSAYAKTPFVFFRSDWEPIFDDTLRMLFCRLKTKSDIPRLRAHLLRHTFAMWYLENGGDLYSLQQILGHISFEMVRWYVHFIPRNLQSTYAQYSPLDRMGNG